MAVKAFELVGTIELQTGKLQAGMRSASRSIKQLETDSKKSVGEVNRHLSSLGSGVGDFISRTGANLLANLGASAIQGATDKMKSLTEQGMGYYDSVQMSRMAFKNLMGDQLKADAHLKGLLKFARETPFDDVPVVQYAQGLQSVGVQAQEVTKYLTGMGNALAGSGRFSIDHQRGLMKFLTDALGKPTLMAEEVKGQLPEHVASGIADLSAALGLSREQLTAKMSKGEIKSRPAIDLLIDYWNKEKAGLMQFAGENTFAGLKSSRESAEAGAMANIFAGGDVMNPALTGAGAGYLQLLRDQIVRRDKFAQGGPAQTALGDIATRYLKMLEANDAAMFALAENTGLAGRTAQNFAKRDGPGGLALPTGVGAALSEELLGDKLTLINMPKLTGEGKLEGHIPDLFRSITGTSIDAVEKGAGPMQEAGALLGEALEKGIDSHWLFGSPSKRAIQLGLWINEGLEIGLTKGQSRNYANLKALTEADPNFIKTLVAGATKRGMNPDDLLNLIGIESGFNKSVVNQFGYGGLGQVGRNERASLGLPRDDAAFKQLLQSNTASWQLTNVIFRLLDQKIKENPGVMKDGVLSLGEGYAMWGSGSATGNPDHIHMARGGKRATAYANNPLWDANKDGVVRESEFAIAARRSLGAGQFFSVNGQAGVNDSHPMPVAVVASAFSGFGGGADGRITGFTGGASGKLVPQFGGTAGLNLPFGLGGTATVALPDRGADTAKKAVQNIESWAGIPTVEELPISKLNVLDVWRSLPDRPIPSFAPGSASGSSGLSLDEINRKRLEALGGSGLTSRGRENAFTWEGGRSDFQGNLQSMLSGLGWEKPGSLGRQFLISTVQSIQGRLAADLSQMISGSLFGDPKEGGGLTGGLLQRLFGGLFGGGRASGGSVSGGRLYMFGERGPELGFIAPGSSGHIYNASQTQAMMSGGAGRDADRVMVYFGPQELGRALSDFGNSPKGRRARVVQAKWGRKLQVASY